MSAAWTLQIVKCVYLFLTGAHANPGVPRQMLICGDWWAHQPDGRTYDCEQASKSISPPELIMVNRGVPVRMKNVWIWLANAIRFLIHNKTTKKTSVSPVTWIYFSVLSSNLLNCSVLFVLGPTNWWSILSAVWWSLSNEALRQETIKGYNLLLLMLGI